MSPLINQLTNKFAFLLYLKMLWVLGLTLNIILLFDLKMVDPDVVGSLVQNTMETEIFILNLAIIIFAAVS